MPFFIILAKVKVIALLILMLPTVEPELLGSDDGQRVDRQFLNNRWSSQLVGIAKSD
ncbi:MAG: hypothetical protein HC851_19770 [Acaryochloris sp. RU_4_1]|nr:hypothetical protein [Acaryochloris sp. RU_4_1]NJR56506.1 hypothetical protein [Acaryochloris sp. CRU_2_0]